jgi:hypothetical protein
LHILSKKCNIKKEQHFDKQETALWQPESPFHPPTIACRRRIGGCFFKPALQPVGLRFSALPDVP